VTNARLRDEGFFHFIKPAPITPSRQLKIEAKTKVDLSGDFDAKVQACSAPMLCAIAEDTKAAVALLGLGQQFLFFGSTTGQCDAQREAYKAAGLNVESYHNNISSWEQKKIVDRFRTGEIQGLCTVNKVNRGFNLPNIALVVIGFGTASRAKYEQMCGRAQRVLEGKTAAWVLDYGGHGKRFGSANWDWPTALEFDRREKLRVPAEELAAQIASGKHDPKCEVRPDNFMDLTEATVDLFKLVVKPARSGKGAILYYVNALGFTVQYVHADTGWTARFLRFLGVPEYQTFAPPPVDSEELISAITSADLPTHLMLRRVYDSYYNKIKIAPVGFRRGDKEFVFDNAAVVTEEWLRHRAHSRLAYAEAAE
jgi:Helicase conserved C-terminal domain